MRLAHRLETGLGHLARFFFWLAGLALFAIVCIILASVVARRIADAPLFYTEELVGLLLSASLFLALPMVTVEASHVRVSFLASVLGERGRAVLAVLAGVVTLGFCGWFLVEGLPWLEFAFKRQIKSEAASLTLWPWMAVLPLSIALCALLVVVRVLTGSEKDSFNNARPSE